MQRYNPKEIEPKWQKVWDETGIYTADLESNRPKYIAMSMFNYPSGAGIHIGHAMNYTISDVKARFKRQQGFESYHPVGWDAFGLPAENYAIKSGVSPQESMANIIPDYHKQYKAMGWSNDWEKEIATHLPEYYKWTQWIFAQMFKHGLAYQDSRMQWWCPIDNTVLANEQVIDGKCWRHDGPNDPPAEKREVKQWFFKITEYADELLEAIGGLDWTESVKLAQKNWIGKSVGAEIDFVIDGSDQKITVFTTRPDTIFGATFLVLAPEHEHMQQLVTSEQKAEVEKYSKQAEQKTDVQRQATKEKTGVFTGAYALNPVSGEKIPIWAADYILTGYGTGAIMGVPAHDERDREFAKAFNLEIRPVVAPIFFEYDPAAIDRPTIVVLARNPANDTYCTINWRGNTARKNASYELPGGGIGDGESFEDAARREFTEETGYTDFTIDGFATGMTTAYWKFERDGETVSKRSLHTLAFATLNSEAHSGVVGSEEYEKNAYDVEWLTKSEIKERFENNWAKLVELAFENSVYAEKEGVLLNSGNYTNMLTHEAREKIVADLAKKGAAEEKTNYRMKDWSVSRQRYWGAPIPIIDCPKCGPQLVTDEDLPVLLPELVDFQPSGDGRSALARAKDWLEVACPKCGGKAERETDTLDTYICSSWYFLRYLDPHDQQQAFDSNIANKWMPVDFYNGADHATAHMLYARFVTRFFTKIGLLDNPEPFKQFLFNGKITAHDGTMFSKSKGNGVDPLDIINQGYGADALRTYLMFASPLELWTRWDPQGVPGTYRFLTRLWNLVQEYRAADATAGSHEEQERKQAQLAFCSNLMIKKVTADVEENRYNTAIAAMMQCVNTLYKIKESHAVDISSAWRGALEALVACVAPFAPHIAEELWFQLGHSTSVHRDSWPKYDEKYLASDTVTVAVQVNGKVRGQVEISPDADEDAALEAAKANENVAAHLDGKEVAKTIYVPGKILNLVVR